MNLTKGCSTAVELTVEAQQYRARITSVTTIGDECSRVKLRLAQFEVQNISFILIFQIIISKGGD